MAGQHYHGEKGNSATSHVSFLSTESDLGAMARSQAALAKRAEKRSVPIEEQRLKDSSKKSRKGEADKKDSVKDKKPSTKKIQPIKDDNDWICTKCTNKNFHHRESCNRCQESRESQKSRVIAAEKIVVVVKPKAVVKKVATINKSVTVASNENWICSSCKNDNFPARTTCNRCQSEKPGSTSSISSSGVKKSVASDVATATTNEMKPSTNRIAKGDGPISGKSLSWGKQATEKEIAENKRLLEVHQCSLLVKQCCAFTQLGLTPASLFLRFSYRH